MEGENIINGHESKKDTVFNPSKSTSPAVGPDIQFGVFNESSLASSNINLSAAIAGSLTLPLQKGPQPNLVSITGGHPENWEESNMADARPRTGTSTDVNIDDKNHRFEMGQFTAIAASDSSDRSKENSGDQKKLRRRAQNREYARKSRLRKREYIQQLEQELQRARQQGIFISSSGDQSHSMSGNGVPWTEEEHKNFQRMAAPETQVASHAQTYFQRMAAPKNKKHKSSLFDTPLKELAPAPQVSHVSTLEKTAEIPPQASTAPVMPMKKTVEIPAEASTSAQVVNPAPAPPLEATPVLPMAAACGVPDFRGIPYMMGVPHNGQSYAADTMIPTVSFLPMMNFPGWGYVYLPQTHENFATCAPIASYSPTSTPTPQSLYHVSPPAGPGTTSTEKDGSGA